LVILQDATFVNQSLLISWNITVLSKNRFECANRGPEARPHRKLRTVGAADIDHHCLLLFFSPGTHSRLAGITLRTHTNPIGQKAKAKTLTLTLEKPKQIKTPQIDARVSV
jgi:hypothetical protein